MLKNYALALLATSALTLATQVQADSLYNWTFTTATGTLDGFGTLTVDTSAPTTFDGYTGYLVTSFTGTYLGQAINSLSPQGTDYGDNLLADLTGTAEQLDHDGITFSYGKNATLENLWVPLSDDVEYATGTYGVNTDRETVGTANGTFVAVPTPEPSTIALAAISGTALLFQLRRRK